jgi:ketosteroid isomerase-like protein
MYRFVVGIVVRSLFAQLRAGRPQWFLALAADDIRFRFPGDHSWAADLHGKEQVREWLQRYVDVGLKLHPHEVVVSGPPWRMTVCTWFTDCAAGPGGEVVYRNEGVLVDRIVWGRVKEHVSFEDTQATARFDDYLRSVGKL